MDYLDTLSAFAANLQGTEVPPAVREQLGRIVADTVAAMVAGSAEPELRAAMHPHRTWGTIGAAAACAQVAGPDGAGMGETINQAGARQQRHGRFQLGRGAQPGGAGVNRGDDAAPYMRDELAGKFMDLTQRVWPTAHAQQVLDTTLAMAAGGATFPAWTALLRRAPLE